MGICVHFVGDGMIQVALILAVVVVIISIIHLILVRRMFNRLYVPTPTHLEFHHHLGKIKSDDWFILKWKRVPQASRYRIHASRKRNTPIIDCEMIFVSETNEIKLPYISDGPWYFKVDALNKDRIVSQCSEEAKLDVTEVLFSSLD